MKDKNIFHGIFISTALIFIAFPNTNSYIYIYFKQIKLFLQIIFQNKENMRHLQIVLSLKLQ
jgi:hypothetical protein